VPSADQCYRGHGPFTLLKTFLGFWRTIWNRRRQSAVQIWNSLFSSGFCLFKFPWW